LCEVEPTDNQKMRVMWPSFLWLQFAVERNNYLHPGIIYTMSQSWEYMEQKAHTDCGSNQRDTFKWTHWV